MLNFFYHIWIEALQYIVYTLNQMGIRLLENYTPYEAYIGSIPSIFHILPFRCLVFIHIYKDLCKKFDAKALFRIFLGYSQETKGYKIFLQKLCHHNLLTFICMYLLQT
jgi:hypothetical protein